MYKSFKSIKLARKAAGRSGLVVAFIDRYYVLPRRRRFRVATYGDNGRIAEAKWFELGPPLKVEVPDGRTG
jgi:hypothetical protein